MKRNLVLAVISGLFLGLSFPPSPLYTLAYVGFIPLFLLFERLETFSQHFRYGYVAMFVFNAVTLYWVGGFTHGRDPYLMLSGGALLLFHPLLSSIPIWLYALTRKGRGLWFQLVAFAFFWVGWEYVHSLGEVSFPWITLGNSQSYDTNRIQIAEFTSVYGLSFMILLFNILAYVLLIRTASKNWTFRSRPAILTIIALGMVYFVPWIYGEWRIATLDQEGSSGRLRVGIVQPNIDPWEKWGEGFASKQEAYERQLNVLFHMTSELSRDSIDLIVWPETAVPLYVLLPQNHPHLWRIQRFVDEIRTPVFSGLPHAQYFHKERAPVTAEKLPSTDDLYVEPYNAATLFSPNSLNHLVYKKIVLVPFAERIPYAQYVPFLIEPLKWSVGISGWGKGTDTLVFGVATTMGDTARFGAMICYESVFPDFVRQFVRKGAEFLIVITNDSWWGNTSGAYQHVGMASLRAVENRRWIVHCANGGISAFVDPLGRIHRATSMYTTASIWSTITRENDLSFYGRHGDLFARICLGGAIVFLGISVASHRRKNENA